jgi:hypothetical protein
VPSAPGSALALAVSAGSMTLADLTVGGAADGGPA